MNSQHIHYTIVGKMQGDGTKTYFISDFFS